MVEKIKDILFPIQYQANAFKQAKKDDIYQNQKYQIIKKQSLYYWFYENEIIIASIVASAIGLRFFVKEAN